MRWALMMRGEEVDSEPDIDEGEGENPESNEEFSSTSSWVE